MTVQLFAKADEPERLMTLLKRMKPASEKHIKSLLHRGLCSVNGKKERFGGRELAKGDAVAWIFMPENLEEIKFDKKRVLFENEELFAYDKPAFISSEDLAALLPRYSLLHRLDKETSGVLLFAKKNKEAFLKLFKKRLLGKSYLALVDGVIKQDSGVIKKPLAPLKRFAGQVIMGVLKEGQEAETRYLVKKRYKDKTLVLCQPITGRTHQIRVHMHSIGHPILGDYHYAESFKCKNIPPRIMLHAALLRILDHVIKAPLPEDFKKESLAT